MRRVSGIAALPLLAGFGATAPVGGASAAEQFVIGVSNTHIGNSWREEFVCSIKAEALASGLVSKIVLANREAGPSEQIADLRKRIGIVLQDFRLLDHMTTYENVALPFRVMGRDESSYRREVIDLLKWVGLGERMDALPPILSGGEKQRAAIARAVPARRRARCTP